MGLSTVYRNNMCLTVTESVMNRLGLTPGQQIDDAMQRLIIAEHGLDLVKLCKDQDPNYDGVDFEAECEYYVMRNNRDAYNHARFRNLSPAVARKISELAIADLSKFVNSVFANITG